MKIQSYFILFFLLGFLNIPKKEATIIQPNIIPKPLFQQLNNGVFELNEATSLETIQEFRNVAQFLKSYVKEQFHLKISSKKSDTKILFTKDHSIKNEEGYLLKIDKNKIEIRANSSKGAFYAVQSLIQLLPIESKLTSISIQCLEIQDAPQFAYYAAPKK